MVKTIDDYNCVIHPPGHRPEREPLSWVCGSYLRKNWNVLLLSSLQRVEKKSRWFYYVTQWKRRADELDVHVVEHRWTCEFPWAGCIVLRQRWNDVLASSEKRFEMMNSRWLSCLMQWERRSFEWTCPWTSTCECDPSGWALVRVVILCNVGSQRYGHPYGCAPRGWVLVGVWYPLLYCSIVRPSCNPNCNVKDIGRPHLNVIDN